MVRRYAGAGKNQVGQYINDLYPKAVQMALADALKTEVAHSLHCTIEQVELDKKTDAGRRRLQDWGAGKREIDPDYWMKKVEYKWQYCHPALLILTDCRFPNEIDWIRSKGGVMVLVDRPGVGPVNEHSSEHAWNDIVPEYCVNNDGSLRDLRIKVFNLWSELHNWGTG